MPTKPLEHYTFNYPVPLHVSALIGHHQVVFIITCMEKNSRILFHACSTSDPFPCMLSYKPLEEGQKEPKHVIIENNGMYNVLKVVFALTLNIDID